MVVWQSAEGEPTDIQRLDIWSPPHQGLSQPLSQVLVSVCVLLSVFVSEAHKKNIYNVIFLYIFDKSIEQRTGKEKQRAKREGGVLLDAY